MYSLLDYHPPAMPSQRFYDALLKDREAKAIIYIDDGVAVFRTFELPKSAAHVVRRDLI